jgi:hypothetical protein
LHAHKNKYKNHIFPIFLLFKFLGCYKESLVAEPKILPEPLADLNFEPLDIPFLDFILDFEDELYVNYENTSKYHRKARKTKKLSNQELLDPFDKDFL